MVRIGDRFDNFVVVSVGVANAVNRWVCYHTQCVFSNFIQDKFEKKIFDACLEDEYNEIKDNQFMMGIGLNAYDEYLRSNPTIVGSGRNWMEQPD